MPESYCSRFSAQQSERHAAIAKGRQGAVALGVFEQVESLTGVCVVADDRPGLLAQISEAFASCGLDIAAAATYTRQTQTMSEAVDLFWLRSPPSLPATDSTQLAKVQKALIALIHSARVPDIQKDTTSRPVSSRNSRVRFIEGENGTLTTLEIETDDRSGLLFTLARTMFTHDLQIVSSEVKTVNNRVIDRFVVAELDDSPVSQERRLELQVAILSAAEPAKRLSSQAPNSKDSK